MSCSHPIRILYSLYYPKPRFAGVQNDGFLPCKISSTNTWVLGMNDPLQFSINTELSGLVFHPSNLGICILD
ncbi:hypothetical protein RchiOBHm_Chr1g0383581 [Rosa chinensis]|uniref:Uncharacterized protein n=1 Tax=Rosa chinensis TaxID=74649 RepID=A0A2P6SPP7_ROSCH|nr:hypothetical protein RchiOBHm_Chr1g0383581 [Rosa chinensis]